jgi:hypothetical protein
MRIAKALRCTPLLLVPLLASPAAALPASTSVPAATPTLAPASSLHALDMLEPGLWQLRVKGEPARNICVSDRFAFIQIRHGGASCSRLVVANEPTRATVHYSCPGAGWGRTTVHAITPHTATIDTQGIAQNAPFAFFSEAHRTGDCGARVLSLTR